MKILHTMKLAWEVAPGETFSIFHHHLAQGKIAATRCPACGQVYLPPRPVCGDCHRPLQDWVEVGGDGVIEALTISHHPILDPVSGKMRATPYVSLLVKLDGASTSVNHYLLDADPRRVAIGSRVESVWREPRRTMADLLGFRLASGPAAVGFPRPLPSVGVMRPLRVPVMLDLLFSYAVGEGAAWFFQGLIRGEILGSRCPSCGQTRVPSRSYCASCFRTLDVGHLAPVGPGGTVEATAGPASKKLGLIRLDGAANGFLHAVKADRGDRVKPLFLPTEQRRGDIRDIECFERTRP